jgi:hypothetical protein
MKSERKENFRNKVKFCGVSCERVERKGEMAIKV